MKLRRRLPNVTRICTSTSILKLNRNLKRIIGINKKILRDVENKNVNNLITTCGINRINVVEPYYNIQRGSNFSKHNYILSFYLSLSNSLYHIKTRIKLNENVLKSKTFYTPTKTSLILLSTIANRNLQKVVYKNGIDIVFTFNKYFGVNIENVYDIAHLISVYSVVDKQQTPNNYGEYLRSQLSSVDKKKVTDSILGLNKNAPIQQINYDSDSSIIDTHLYLNENSLESFFPFQYIDRLRIYLYNKYNINNETYNLKMEEIYNEIKAKPRIYKSIYKNQLDFGKVNSTVFKDKFFSSLFNKDQDVQIMTDPGPFYGVLTEIKSSEQKVFLNINSFLVDEVKGEVFPVYGIVNSESFKYFSDKKIGDVVECVESNSEEIKIIFKEGRPYVQIKRLHQESLIYSLKNKRYVPINEISFNK